MPIDNARDDEIVSWGAAVFDELGWMHGSNRSPLGVEQLCTIICLVGLTTHPASRLLAGSSPARTAGC